MKQVSALYKSLRIAEGSWYDVEVICDGNTYGIDKLKSVKIYPELFSPEMTAPHVGGANSAKCEVSLIESSANWPRMAEFTVRLRLVSEDNTQQSEWLTMGVFYTDERSEDKYGNLNIIAYDGMLLTEQYWTDKIPSASLPSNWPITAKAFCDMLENQNLISIDSRTVLDDTVAFIGLDTSSTIRDKLKDIAAAHGGNWMMTSENKLRLVPFANAVDGSAAIAGIAIVGISVVGDGSYSIDNNADYVYLGMNVMGFDSSPSLPGISKVILESENKNTSESGETSGYTLQGNCNFSTTDGVADLCLSKTSGYVYKPFSANGAVLDPIADLGDLVVIDGRSYQVMTISWNINTWPTADISAPYEAEVDHEYPKVDDSTKTYRKAVATTDEKLKSYTTSVEMESAIEQSEQAITLTVSQHYVTIEDYEDAIENLQSQIDGSINSFSGPDVPTLNNYPANEWTTASERQQHVGALYLVTSDSQSGQAGQYYRFEQSGNNFAWTLVEDSALATALANAAAAQEAAEQAQEDAETAQQAAEAAQGTADQARAEAVAQAAQAQAVAITQAAIDATNKANQALADAKAYSDQQVNDFINGQYADTIALIQNQVDQKIETYYQDTDPSLSWLDASNHVGDLWNNTSTQLSYRWNGTEWEEMTTNPPRGVFDQIDGKASVFYTQPVPPYNENDLWTQGANGDILRCNTARGEGEAFNPNDWTRASKYTDDSSLSIFINGLFAESIESLRQQLDGKAETFYQEDEPSDGGKRWDAVAGRAIVGKVLVGSTLELHVGDLWYRTTDNTTWRYTGSSWVQETIPTEVFDTIDGKANIFIAQPVPPYKAADLWVEGSTGDIYRCKAGVDKEAGQTFSVNDWELASKYTDDTKANAVEADLHDNYTTTVDMNSIIEQTASDVKIEVYRNTISENLVVMPYNGSFRGGRSYDYQSEYGITINVAVDGTLTINGTAKKDFNVVLVGKDFPVTLPDGDYICGGHASDADKVGFRIGSVDYNNVVSWITDRFDAHGTETFTWASQSNQILYLYLQMTLPSSVVYSNVTVKPQVEVGTVLHGWMSPVLSTQSQLKVTSDEITAQVVSKNGGSQNSFGWTLTDNDWSLYSNGSRVFRASSSGIEINGSGTFTGTVNASSGTFTGTVNATGGTFTGPVTANNLTIDGGSINLGNGAFVVSSTGAVTATNMNVQGGSISIGTDFYVSPQGQLRADSGTFGGNLSAAGGSFTGELQAATGSFSGSLSAATGEFWGDLHAAGGTFNGDLQAAGGTFSGDLQASGGTFSGNLQAVGGTFTGELQAATGTFSGNLSAAGGTFNGDISGANGTFTGNLSGSTITGGSISIGGTASNPTFEVDTSGNLTAKSAYIEGEVHATSGEFTGTISGATIQGGTISIGNGNFVVDQYGNVTAQSGTFLGTVQARNIQVGDTAGYIQGTQIDSGTIQGTNIDLATITGSNIDTGTITGSNIDVGTITGTNIDDLTIGSDKLQLHSLSDDQIVTTGLTTGGLSSGVVQSLGYADTFNLATTFGTETYPNYFTAGRLISMSNVYASEVELRPSAFGEQGVTLSNHYHSIIVNADGTVTFGSPYNSSTPPSFRIADTKAYKDGVSAITASSIHYEQGEGGVTDYTSIFVHLSSSIDPNYSKNVTGFSNAEAVNYGFDNGVRDVNATAMSVGAVNAPTQDEDGYWISQATGTVTIGATLSDGTEYSKNVEFSGRNINVTAAYNAGKGAATVSDITEDTSRQKRYSNKQMDIPVKAIMASGGQPFADMLEDVDVTLAYNDGANSMVVDAPTIVNQKNTHVLIGGSHYTEVEVNSNAHTTTKSGSSKDTLRVMANSVYNIGKDDGAETAYPYEASVSSISNPTKSGSTYKSTVTFKSRARGTYSTGHSPQYYYSDERTIQQTQVDVTNVYTAGANSVTIPSANISATPSWNSTTKKYDVAITATTSSNQSGNKTISVTPSDAWNAGGRTSAISGVSPTRTYLNTDDDVVVVSGRIKLDVPVIVTPKYTNYSGQNVTNSDNAYSTTVRFDIKEIWDRSAGQGIAVGRDDAINGLSMNSNNISYPSTLGDSYPVGTQRFVNFTATASVSGTTYSDGTSRNVSAEKTVSMNVTNIFNQGVEEGESHYSGPTESVTLYCTDYNSSRRVYTFQAQIYGYSFNVNQGYVFYFY